MLPVAMEMGLSLPEDAASASTLETLDREICDTEAVCPKQATGREESFIPNKSIQLFDIDEGTDSGKEIRESTRFSTRLSANLISA